MPRKKKRDRVVFMSPLSFRILQRLVLYSFPITYLQHDSRDGIFHRQERRSACESCECVP